LRNVVAQGQNRFEQRDIFVAGEVVVLAQQFFAGLLAFGVVHDPKAGGGDVGHDRVLVIAGFDLLEEVLGQALQLGPGELDRLLGLGDVAFIIGGQPGEFFAHPLDLVALGFGQLEAGAAVIAQGLGQELGVLALERGLGVGVGLEGRIHILAVVEADHPLLKLLERIRGGVADDRVGAGFLDE